MSVRAGHEWYCGPPGSWTDAHLRKLAGRWIACPGCTIDAYTSGNCHTSKIIDEFRAKWSALEAPKFVSMCTKTVEGNGGLRDVLVARDAVFAGCKRPRGAPTSRELGVSLPASIFGNPEVQKRLEEGKEKARETKQTKKREAKRGVGCEMGVKCDLPVRTIAQANAEHAACFEKAWAQKRAREAAQAKGVPFVPEWENKQKQQKPATTCAVADVARKEADAQKAKGAAHAVAVTAALNRRTDSDSDSD